MSNFYKPLTAVACSLAVLVALSGCEKPSHETSAAASNVEAQLSPEKSLWPRIESAVKTVLATGPRTGDIWRDGKARTGTAGMGDAIVAALAKQQ